MHLREFKGRGAKAAPEVFARTINGDSALIVRF
jgi:hypothetical protein